MTVAERPDVTFFMPSLRGGGAERVMLDLAQGVASRGYAVDVLILNRVGAVTSGAGEGVNLVDLQRSRAATALPALVGYLRGRRPPVLLSTIEQINVLAVLAAGIVGGTRVVVREANTPSEDLASEGLKGRVVRFAMRHTYRRAAQVIAVSDGVAGSLTHTLGLEGRDLTVIANPVITDRLREGARGPVRHPWFEEDGEPVLLAVGRLVEQKGFDTLVRALALARERTPCRLVILGEGPLREELTSLADSLGIGEHLSLPGFQQNPFAYMANCDLFVLSSRWEGLPNVLIQAMAVGAKAVSTDCPSGPAEVLGGGEHGALVPVDDPEALSDAIVQALAAPRRELPAEWYARYDASNVIDRYLEVLQLPPRIGVTREPGIALP